MLRGLPSGEPSRSARIAAVLYFISSSMLVQFTTKATFTTFDFQHPLTLALAQMAVVAPVSYAVSRKPLTLETARTLLPMAMVNVLNVVCGLVATATLTVPMFIALRRFTLLFTLLLERFWLGRTHDRATVGAMALTIGGAVLAAATDPTLTLRGVVAVLANDVLTSLYLIVVKRTPAAAQLSSACTLFYNSALSLPLLAVAAFLSGDLRAAVGSAQLGSPAFLAAFLGAAALGLSINHSTFLCTRLNEPIATSAAGNLKNALMTAAGALLFPDFVYAPLSVAGLTVSMAGAAWYATKSALKARQRSIKDSLLQQLPIIGRDRSKRTLAVGPNGLSIAAPSGAAAGAGGSAASSASVGYYHPRTSSLGARAYADLLTPQPGLQVAMQPAPQQIPQPLAQPPTQPSYSGAETRRPSPDDDDEATGEAERRPLLP